MKIEIRKLQFGLMTADSDIIKRSLFQYMHEQVYGHLPYAQWQHVSASSPASISSPKYTNLIEMARKLRQQGWSVYYWRDRHGLDNVHDDNSHINYGRREGLIVGAYCANLTAWLLANT